MALKSNRPVVSKVVFLEQREPKHLAMWPSKIASYLRLLPCCVLKEMYVKNTEQLMQLGFREMPMKSAAHASGCIFDHIFIAAICGFISIRGALFASHHIHPSSPGRGGPSPAISSLKRSGLFK